MMLMETSDFLSSSNRTSGNHCTTNSTDTTDWNETTETYANVSFILAWLILAFSCLSFLTNLLSASVFSDRSMRSPINILLTGLCAIDCIMSLFWIPAFVIPCLYVYYRSPGLKSAMAISQVYFYPVTFICNCSSAYIFVVISLERMTAVLRPFRARWHSNRRSVGALLMVIFLSASYNCVRFFEFRLVTTNDNDPEDAALDTMPVLRDSEQHPMYMALYYNGLFFAVHFLGPFTVLLVVNTLMVISIYRAGAERRLLSIQQKRENRTAVMMAMTVLSFLTCNTLQLILNAIELVNPDFFTDPSTLVLAFTLNDVCNLLVVVNTSSTALIYFFFCQKYRRVASELLRRAVECAGCGCGAAVRRGGASGAADFYNTGFTEVGAGGTQRGSIQSEKERRISAPNSRKPYYSRGNSVFRVSNRWRASAGAITTGALVIKSSVIERTTQKGDIPYLDDDEEDLDEECRIVLDQHEEYDDDDTKCSTTYGRAIVPERGTIAPVSV